jgi:hypothetical protein
VEEVVAEPRQIGREPQDAVHGSDVNL